MKLNRKSVAKPWGQSGLPELFGKQPSDPIGEIWFEAPKGVTPALMIKYLFTSEKLSIQVHPNDRQARRQGFPNGKDECWYVLDAKPDAVLGLGLTKEVSKTKLHAAVVCGQLDPLIDWKPVKAGDFFFVPAGTIHAIGPGVTLVEVQQNIDLTYRLYDYGRGRDLHLEEALSVSTLSPYDMKNHQHIDPAQSRQLQQDTHFRTFQIIGNDPEPMAEIKSSEWQVVPLNGKVIVRDQEIGAGECGLCTRSSEIDLTNNEKCLIACTVK